MTGFIGSTADGDRIGELASGMVREDWYELSTVREGQAGVGVLEHGSRDPDANAVWRGDGLLGVVYGVVSNRDRHSHSWGEVFRAVADGSRTILPDLEGPFALACVDARADRVHLATDKAGTRPVYYTVDGPVRFASELSPLLSAVESPTLDAAAVSDLLLAGGVLGERTLVESVASLPPATRVTVDGTDGSVSTERYWTPERTGLAPSGYPDRWLEAYRSAVGDVATTAGDPSLWFPGEVGSRIAAAVFAASGCAVETLTCGGPTGGDRESAAQMAAYLDLPNRQGHDDPDRHLVDAVADAVAATDAMVEWTAVEGLPYATDALHADADALVFGCPLGPAPWVGTVGPDDDPVAALADHKCVCSPEAVGELLATDRDPLASLEAVRTDAVPGPTERTAVDAAFRIRAATRLRSRAVQRSQVGTRTLAHGAFLDTIARMPACYRTETLPVSGPTESGEPPIRAAAVRRLDANLAQIPGGSGDRVRASGGNEFRADGAGESPRSRSDGDAYVRRYATDDRLRRFVDDLLGRVGERDPLDADAVDALRDKLATGELSSFAPVAALTGLELWAGRHLDGTARLVAGVEA